jgi:hypothetical protein
MLLPFFCTKQRVFRRYEHPITGVAAFAKNETRNWKCVCKTGVVAYRNTPLLEDMHSDLSAAPKVRHLPQPELQSRKSLIYLLQFGSIISATEISAEDGGHWLKVEVEKLGAKYVPIVKEGEVFFESAAPVALAASKLPSEGSKSSSEGSKASLRDRVKSVGSSIGA